MSVSYAALKGIGLPDAVFLLFDKDTHRIALEGAPSDHAEAYPARIQGKKDKSTRARVISASAFMNHINIDLDAAVGRYPATIEDKIVVAQLKPEHFKE